jgi:hypothetical protein
MYLQKVISQGSGSVPKFHGCGTPVKTMAYISFFVLADPAEFLKYNFNVKEGDIHIQWMAGAQTNISYNALGKVK